MFRTMPPMQKQFTFKAIIGLCIIGIGVWLLLLGKGGMIPDGNAVQEGGASSTISMGGVNLNVPDGVTVEQLPLEPKDVTAPALDRKITFPDFYTGDAKSIMQQKIDDAVGQLKEDPTQFAYWLELATLRSNLQDYGGAKEIYEYLNAVSPNNSISFMNLGNLDYLYFKDYPEAEKNLKQAVVNNPKNMQTYRSLYELYSVYKKDTNAGVDALLEALAVEPDNIDFLILTGREYENRGDTANARTYLGKARDQAQSLGNQTLADTLDKELSSL